MAGRPRLFDEGTALKKAGDLFWAKGYASASTEELIDIMGLKRSSFYNSFGSKRELFIRALDHHETPALAELRKMLKESRQPMQVIRSVFFTIADCRSDEYPNGCFAGNTISELSNMDEELVEKAAKYLRTMKNIFAEQIKRSQASGELKTRTDAEYLAVCLINLWNGIHLTRKIFPSRKILHEMVTIQLSVLK